MTKNIHHAALSLILLAAVLFLSTPGYAFFAKSEKVKLLDAPPMVQQTLHRVGRWATGVSLERQDVKGETVYSAELSAAGDKVANVKISSTGRLLEYAYKEQKKKHVEWVDVPPAVQKTLQLYADRRHLDTVTRVMKDGVALYTGKVELPHFMKLEVKVLEDGRLLEFRTKRDYSTLILTNLNRDL